MRILHRHVSDARRGVGPARSTAFTLVELLVVIGIIGLLIGILLPAVGRVRLAARRTETLSTLNRLSAACEQYFLDFTSYPGAVPNAELAGTGNTLTNAITFKANSYPDGSTPANATSISGTENMVMSLLGGLRYTGTSYVYDLTSSGQGPASLNAMKPARHQPYLEIRANELSTSTPNPVYSANPPGQWLQTSATVHDSQLPEIVDNFAVQRPILYVRANRGNQNTVNTSTPPAPAEFQYDLRQLYAYGFPVSTDPVYQAAYPADSVAGLSAGDGSYFCNHELSRPGLAVVQHKDGFLLISAGPDGIYGTADDIRN